MDSLRGYTSDAGFASAGKAVSKAVGKRKVHGRQILGDRSSRDRNEENATPAAAPSTLVAPGTLVSREKAGPGSLQSSQQTFIQANCKKGQSQTPVAAPAQLPRGGATGANELLIVQNRELYNRAVELEKLLRTSEEEKTQLRQQVRGMEAHVASQERQLKEVQAAEAERTKFVSTLQARVDEAESEATEVRNTLTCRTEYLRNAQTEIEAALVRTNAAEATAALVSAEATEMRVTLQAREISLRDARAASVQAQAETKAAKESATRAKAEADRAKVAEAGARAAAAKPNDENAWFRRRLASIAAHVRGPPPAPFAAAVILSGRTRGKVSSRWATGCRQGGRGGGDGKLSTAAPREDDIFDDEKRAEVMKELCELVSFGTGSTLREDVLEGFLTRKPSSSSRGEGECPTSEETRTAPAPPPEAVDVVAESNITYVIKKVEARNVSRDGSLYSPIQEAGAASPVRPSSLRRQTRNVRSAEKQREAQRLEEGRESDAVPRAQEAKQDRVTRQLSQFAEGGDVNSKPEQPPPSDQCIQRPEIRNKAQSAGRRAASEGEGHNPRPQQQQQRSQRKRRESTNHSAMSTAPVAIATAERICLPTVSETRTVSPRDGEVCIETDAHRAPAAPNESIAGMGTLEEHEEVEVEEVPMPGGGGDNDTFFMGADEVGLLGPVAAAENVSHHLRSSGEFPVAANIGVRAIDRSSLGGGGGEASMLRPLVGFVVGGQPLGDYAAEPEEEAVSKRSTRRKGEKELSRTTRRRSMRQLHKSAVLFREKQEAQREQEATATAIAKSRSEAKVLGGAGESADNSTLTMPVLAAGLANLEATVDAATAAADAAAIMVHASPVLEMPRASKAANNHRDVNPTPRRGGPVTRALTSPDPSRCAYGAGAAARRTASTHRVVDTNSFVWQPEPAADAAAIMVHASPVLEMPRVSEATNNQPDINPAARRGGPVTRALTSPDPSRRAYGTGAAARGTATTHRVVVTNGFVRKPESPGRTRCSEKKMPNKPVGSVKDNGLEISKRKNTEEAAIERVEGNNRRRVYERSGVLKVLSPFAVHETANAVMAADVERAARQWFEEVYVPGGVLAGVLAAAGVMAEKIGGATALGAANNKITQQLRSLLTAFVSAESSAIRHGSDGDMTEAAPPHGDRKVKGTTGATAPSAWRLRFCAFDLSSVDMPSDARRKSDEPAKEIVSCLELVVAHSDRVQQALQSSNGSGRDVGCVTASAAATWAAWLRGLQTLAVADSTSPLIGEVQDACLSIGSQVSGKVITRAARFLLDELEPLGAVEVPLQSPLRSRLASILSALIRFNLRRLLNPPPASITKPPTITPGSTAQTIPPSTDHSDVHKLVQLVLDEGDGPSKAGAASDGATSAVLTMAVSKLFGYSADHTEEVVGAAEAFLSANRDSAFSAGTSNSNVDGRSKLTERETLEMLVELAQRARQHLVDTVEVMAAIKARGFVLSLLEHPGVEDAIARAGGWADVEKFSSALEKVKDFPDADVHLTLLSDMKALKKWLGREELWSSEHEARATTVLNGLDRLIVKCAERRTFIIKGIALRESKESIYCSGAKSRGSGRGALLLQGSVGACGDSGARGITSQEAREINGTTLREAKELGQEARRQMDFPNVRVPMKGEHEEAGGHELAGQGAERYGHSPLSAF